MWSLSGIRPSSSIYLNIIYYNISVIGGTASDESRTSHNLRNIFQSADHEGQFAFTDLAIGVFIESDQ